MNSILIVEDDDNKRDHITQVLNEFAWVRSVEGVSSYQSGLKRLIGGGVDLLILDMTLPTFERGPQEPGGRTRPFAGREILEQIERRRLPVQVVVVSGFEILGEGSGQKTLSELDKELRAKFAPKYKGYVYYNPAQTEWRSKLVAVLQSLVGGGSV